MVNERGFIAYNKEKDPYKRLYYLIGTLYFIKLQYNTYTKMTILAWRRCRQLRHKYLTIFHPRGPGTCYSHWEVGGAVGVIN